jgi:CopG family transcriptional regulator, nickel-responsive regulator
MGELFRFGVSAEEDLLASFDRLIAAQGYGNRSEALRDLMRDALVRSHMETPPPGKSAVLGSLTLVYDHHARDLTDRMANIQHEHHGLVISVLHVHVSHDDCMEVVAMRGRADDVRTMAESLLSLKGVKHGKLFMTLPSRVIVDQPGTADHKHSHSHSATHSHQSSRKKSAKQPIPDY